MGLKKQHIEVLKALVEFADENGFSPSIRELTKLTHYSSTSTIATYLRVLEGNGYIQIKDRTSRGIRIIKREVEGDD